MPELRKDPVLGRWIIIAKERRKRPTDFVIEKPKVVGGFCPLCPGNENFTPPEVLAYRNNIPSTTNEPDWQVRVVPNKYPALIIEGELVKEAEGLYDKTSGIGAHEVIIECGGHGDIFWDLPVEHISLVLKAFRDRMKDLEQDARFRYVMVFKNFGKAAGASLEHSHSQLIALPVLPRMIVSELEGAQSYYDYKDRCLFCDIIKQEVQQEIRVVCQNEQFITISPFAPRTPFEMWVLPKEHASGYCRQSNDDLTSLARIMSESLRRLDRCIPNVPYNFVLHTQPLRSGELDHFHWHFEIVPTLTSIAGFEWGSGFYINPLPPEEATQYLRESLDN
jgi:UDPglucose--hexose-1-phosphate uridylyltransferase